MRRSLVVAAVAASVLAGTAAVVVLVGTGGAGGSGYRPHPASVRSLAAGIGGPVAVTFAATDLPPARGARDPRAAVAAYLGAVRAGDIGTAARLLPDGERTRLATLTAYGASLTGSRPPLAFEILGTETDPTATGDVLVRTRVHRTAALDPFAGFTPDLAVEEWRAVPSATGWRVAPVPDSSRPVLPPPAGVVTATRGWLAALARCDTAAAARFVAGSVGDDSLVSAACSERGAWRAASTPLPYDEVTGAETFLTTYGTDLRTWARFVAVTGPRGDGYLVALAPVGDSWRVAGAIRATAGRG